MSPAQERINATLARIPYAGFLGVRGELRGDELTFVLPFSEHLIGNPMLPALHGGAVGAFMELTAILQLAMSVGAERTAKTIAVNVDYLRSGRPEDTFARARVIKIGRRVANVQVEAWQGERAQPIAALHGHFLVSDSASATA
jgi:uncharacterized protein (TIGR00369 family)